VWWRPLAVPGGRPGPAPGPRPGSRGPTAGPARGTGRSGARGRPWAALRWGTGRPGESDLATTPMVHRPGPSDYYLPAPSPTGRRAVGAVGNCLPRPFARIQSGG